MKFGCLYSSGKDSTYALYLALKKGYEVPCLITIKSKNKDSYMFHSSNIDLTSLQSESLGIPLLTHATKGEKELELKDLETAIKKAVKEYKIEGIITGALFSEYQASRIQKICDSLNLKCFNPLWHKSQEKEMRELIENNFEFIFTQIAAEGLTKEWLGKRIGLEELDKLIKLHKKNGLNIAGEGGEFESLVLNCPIFKKKLVIEDFEVEMESKNTGKIVIKEVELN